MNNDVQVLDTHILSKSDFSKAGSIYHMCDNKPILN